MGGPRVTHYALSACVYCGAMAESRDHVLSLSCLGQKRKNSERHKGTDWLVPACLECNVTLCDKYLDNIPARAEHLFVRFTKKWRKILKSPTWSESELAELGETLRRSIMQAMAQRKNCRDRLKHLEWVMSQGPDYLSPRKD